jgi:hypothetical protein
MTPYTSLWSVVLACNHASTVEWPPRMEGGRAIIG